MWEKTKTTASNAFEILKAAGKEYGADRVSRMAAAVAYRSIFALVPLFLLAVGVFGLVLGADGNARAQILSWVQQFAGGDVEEAMIAVLDAVETSGDTASVVGFGLLVWTASSLFMELQRDLNDIFHVPRERTKGPVAFVKKRGLGFLFSLGLGLVLVSVVLLNTVWQFLGDLFPESFEPVHQIIAILAPLGSLIILPLVMALTFQVLSRAKVRWKAVWLGSFFTSVAFLAAAYGASLYFRLSGPSAAGVAGSIFVILLLAFILSAVYLYGAEVTKVYNDYLDNGDIQAPTHRNVDGEAPEVVVHEPRQPVPVAVLFAFLGGLFVGWRRDR